jgi:hypothetical protein
MVIRVLLAAIGIMMVLMASREMILTLRNDSFRALGNRLIRRKAHPVIFWMELGALVIVGLLGLAVIAWALIS